jgi:hypothetical protein
MRRVVVHPNQLVHYATPRPTTTLFGDAISLTEQRIREEEWHYWHTICGKDVIGHPNDEFYPEVTCRACLRSFERARKTYAELEGRFGVRDGAT